jgi:hemerythrin-like domain-containing protein
MESQLLQRLNEDHEHISQVLDALENELQASDTHDVDWRIVDDIMTYLQDYPDAVHHPLEDQLFDRVLDKGLTPAERELVHFNLAQHAEIIGASHQLAQDVHNILNDIVIPIGQVQAHFLRYLEIQRLHMRNEQTNLFPLAQRLLSVDEWREVGAVALSQTDPLFEAQLEKFAGLYKYITDQ